MELSGDVTGSHYQWYYNDVPEKTLRYSIGAIYPVDMLSKDYLPAVEPPYEVWHQPTGMNDDLISAFPIHNFSQRIRWRCHSQWWNIPWIRLPTE